MNRPEWLFQQSDDAKTTGQVLREMEACAKRFHNGEVLEPQTTGYLLDMLAADMRAALLPDIRRENGDARLLREAIGALQPFANVPAASERGAPLSKAICLYEAKEFCEDYGARRQLSGNAFSVARVVQERLVRELEARKPVPSKPVAVASMMRELPGCSDEPPSLFQALRRLVEDIEHLMSESHGVDGFHSDGGSATWNSFQSGGSLSSYLGDALDAANAALDAEVQRPTQPTHKPAQAEAAPVKAEAPANASGEPSAFVVKPTHESLARVLQLALNQAQSGKGQDRHGDGRPFTEQPIFNIARTLTGIDGHVYQVMKKGQEAARMVHRDLPASAVAELLGVIVYAGAAVALLQERHNPNGEAA